MSMQNWYKHGKDLLEEINITKVPENSVALWFLGQESIIIKYSNEIIYIDPYFSEPADASGKPKRKFPAPYKPDEINHADWVICTHNHSDHIDPYALTAIAANSSKAMFVVPAPHTGVLESKGIAAERIMGAKSGETLELSGLIKVTPVPAAHEDYVTNEAGEHLFLGYVMDINGIKIYHGGDCVEKSDTVDMMKPYKIDLAFLPINGADWKRRSKNIIGNMNAREAADVAAGIGADVVIPVHFDLFPFNGENPAHFVDYMYSCYPARKFHIMVPGERYIYMK